METRKLKLALSAGALALSMALAGCGGGGSAGAPGDPPVDPDPPPPSPANLTTLFGAVQTASSDAVKAGKAAMEAQKDAQASAKMLTTTQVGGDSMKAMMNAETILDARDDAVQAVMDAEAALEAAQEAEEDAKAVADDHPEKVALMAAVEEAVKKAKAQVEAATKVRDGLPIKNAVFAVEGPDKKRTPRSIANMVGMDIAGSLAPGNNFGRARGTLANDKTGFDGVTTKALKYEMDDHQGMTWAEIVGESNVMKKRLGTIDDAGALTAGNEEVSVASLEGMTASAVVPTGTDFTTAGVDGVATNSGNYMGIPGAVVCLGGSDGCKVTDGKLGAGWYFSPAMPMAYYQNQKDDPDTPDKDESLLYGPETLYASYGYWLTSEANNGATEWTVHTFATSTGGTAVN